jgi:AraC-like DNA-binding protein
MGQLSGGPVSMKQAARQLAVSVATLRRKLEEEGTSFSALLDAARREAAERYLSKPEPTVTEIAFLLGFSNLRAFSRAFRRWTGSAPTQFRERAQRSADNY